jgi:hypothetical protein
MKETLIFYYLSDLPIDAGVKVGVRPGLLPGAKVAFPSWLVGLPFAAQVSAQISATSDDAACCNRTLVNCITDTNCFHEKT